jgi:coenzyme F420-0:L-glutamate ligase/coenzyme F420-1:gamma-L-glutamate ligase
MNAPMTVFPLQPFPFVKEGDDVGRLVVETSSRNPGQSLKEDDVVVVAHKLISRAEGNTVDLESVSPSLFAQNTARMGEKDPRIVETVLRESRTIVRMSPTLLITESRLGFISANSGVDKSNSPGDTVLTHPHDPDSSSRKIRETIARELKIRVSVLISDTFGHPFRVGTTNVAIGCAGMLPIEDFRGRPDLFGYVLQHTTVNRADEIAAAAGNIMGQAAEGIPVIIVRGAKYQPGEGSAQELIRPRESALFW